MKKLILAFVCLFLAASSQAKIIYVDDNAPGPTHDGSSWADAYNYLQDALADANSSSKPVEIRVAQGIYTPDSTSAEPNGTGDRGATFQLINGATLQGGYAGFGEPDPNVRGLELYESILSGDLGGNDIDVNDPCDLIDEPTRAENSYHVVTASGTDNTAVLDGLTITGGNINSWGPWRYKDDYGGGMMNWDGSPTINNCTFSANSARVGGGMANFRSSLTLTKCTFSHNYAFEDGGGMHNYDGSSSIISHCTFRGNAASSGGGVYNERGSSSIRNCSFRQNAAGGGGGGGVYNSLSNLKLTDCTFLENVSKAEGGGISDTSYGSPRGAATLTNCRFIRNSAVKGGGMCIAHSRPTLTNCMFIGNSADFGGATALCDSAIATYSRCTFAANSAQYGKAISCSSCWYTRSRNIVRLNNCIVWDGGQEIHNDNNSISPPDPPPIPPDPPPIPPCPPAGPEESSNECNSIITIIYSDVQGGWPGAGNIDVDPCFADANNVDYHLKSEAGRWEPPSQNWVQDDVTSPCIDAGNPMSPISNEPFPNGGRVNVGAYGGTAESGKSYFGEPVCETIVAGDINGDCIVNFKDLAFMAFHWLEDRGAANSNTIVDDGIEYYVQTDKSVYELGEHTEILYRITNLTNEVWAVVRVCRVMDILVEVKEGENLRQVWTFGWEHSHPPGPTGVVLWPGESAELRVPWPQFNMNWTGDRWEYAQAPSGTYRITGVIYGYSSVSVDITVEY